MSFGCQKNLLTIIDLSFHALSDEFSGKYQKVLGSIRKHWKKLESTVKYQRSTRKYQKALESTREVPGITREVLECTRKYQKALESTREVPESTRKYQKILGSTINPYYFEANS